MGHGASSDRTWSTKPTQEHERRFANGKNGATASDPAERSGVAVKAVKKAGYGKHGFAVTGTCEKEPPSALQSFPGEAPFAAQRAPHRRRAPAHRRRTIEAQPNSVLEPDQKNYAYLRVAERTTSTSAGSICPAALTHSNPG